MHVPARRCWQLYLITCADDTVDYAFRECKVPIGMVDYRPSLFSVAHSHPAAASPGRGRPPPSLPPNSCISICVRPPPLHSTNCLSLCIIAQQEAHAPDGYAVYSSRRKRQRPSGGRGRPPLVVLPCDADTAKGVVRIHMTDYCVYGLNSPRDVRWAPSTGILHGLAPTSHGRRGRLFFY